MRLASWISSFLVRSGIVPGFPQVQSKGILVTVCIDRSSVGSMVSRDTLRDRALLVDVDGLIEEL